MIVDISKLMKQTFSARAVRCGNHDQIRGLVSTCGRIFLLPGVQSGAEGESHKFTLQGCARIAVRLPRQGDHTYAKHGRRRYPPEMAPQPNLNTRKDAAHLRSLQVISSLEHSCIRASFEME